MSHPTPHGDDEAFVILKPQPQARRSGNMASSPPNPSSDSPSCTNELLESSQLPAVIDKGGSGTPSRTRSFINLSASTLFGIYQLAGLGTEAENATPWGTGAQTPAETEGENLKATFDISRVSLPDSAFHRGADGRIRRRGTAQELHRLQVRRRGFKGYILPLAGRLSVLFGIGMLYGLIISHLHDKQKLVPVRVSFDRSQWGYLIAWGCIGTLLGSALPLADVFWAPADDAMLDGPETELERKENRGMDEWMDVARSIGAFVGIAFAIRKLPWQSTLQMCLTLALANPAVWYLIDRSPPGFIMSTLVALTGTAVLLGTNPALMSPPSSWVTLQGHATSSRAVNLPDREELVLGIFRPESLGLATWTSSVLFVSSVCFGNIGRRLAPPAKRL